MKSDCRCFDYDLSHLHFLGLKTYYLLMHDMHVINIHSIANQLKHVDVCVCRLASAFQRSLYSI